MSRAPGPDIRRPEAVDEAWLEAVLGAAGIQAKIRSFTARAVGTGQIGDSVRFSLDYADRPAEAPASLVGKFPSAGEESRNTGVVLGNYRREVRFYQQLAPRALIRTPRCYFTDVEEATSEFVLMMEDLAPAEQGDQLRGVSVDQARLVLVEAAKLHAAFWGQDWLDDLPWVQGSRAAPPSMVTDEAVYGLWLGFKERYGPRLEPHWIEVGEKIASRYTALGAAYDGPRCLAHNDFRPDNMMFGTPAGGYPVTVLDWQSFSYGSGATDVAYFLAGALSPDIRREVEDELLALYHDTLCSLGVTNYDRDALKRHYGRGATSLFVTAFFAAMIVTQTPRGDEMFLKMLGSAADHLIDHDALD